MGKVVEHRRVACTCVGADLDPIKITVVIDPSKENDPVKHKGENETTDAISPNTC